MIIFPYKPGQLYDDGLIYVIRGVQRGIVEKDDDGFLVACGDTGTGKTSLMFHAYELYDPEGATVDQVALTRKDFAGSLKTAKHQPKGRRFCGNDEANVNKRDSLTKFNKAVVDLYFSIRGLGILHWWNNPSIEYLDKVFIEERIKGVFFIFTKDKKRPRLYYYFRKVDLLGLLEKAGDLKPRTLKKYAAKYAYYRGWFLPYAGRLWADYLVKKQLRMEDKVESFFAEYGGDLVSRPEYAQSKGVATDTVYGWEKKALEAGLDPSQVVRNGGDRVYYTQEACRFMDDLQTTNKKRKRAFKMGTSPFTGVPAGVSSISNARSKE